MNTGTAGNNTKACFVIDSPQALRFCDARRWTTNVRFLATMQLPWDINAGITYQDNPGPEILANYSVANADITSGVVKFVNPSRTTFSGASATVPLLAPGAMFQDRMRQVDLRLAKSFQYRGMRARFSLDLANMFNTAAVITHNTTYGGNWLKPTYTLQGRIVKPGLTVEF